MKNIIEAKHLGISFGDKNVIEDLSFEVRKGEIFGFLGSNGSGKTTTIRALLGLYQPSRGSILINGKIFAAGAEPVGYLPEERGLYKKETVLDVMVYFGRLKGMDNPLKWSLDYLNRVGLSDKPKERIDHLSSGQQQKVQLGITIMNNPELLILDEPTKGFDPVNRKLLMDIIDERHRAGATIILITHYMDEVERLCDRALLLKDGVAKVYGTIAAIKKQFGGQSLDEIFVKIYGSEDA
ncbi:MAG: ATP-binding cassette domain-containing protein [Candidatus Nomurabacteria bacterium]|jgi:ABC-2 type transport system ATP-binding protein|nr:ATP-binding cassette domain-containing protein [Candidatus Nomurabacteria bacterium]